MKKNKILTLLYQLLAGLLLSYLLSLILAAPIWWLVLYLGNALNHIGVMVDLVGEPQSKDPGAVAAALLFGILCLLTSYSLFRKGKPRAFTLSLAFFGVIFSINVFILVSSLIWF